jgi:predicted alpha/beta hydrolase family esterase
MTSSHVFILPGIGNSGPLHWQTKWEELYGFTRIRQNDWDRPVCEEWISAIDAAITPFPPSDVILVGHSLACSTIAHWAGRYQRKIRGALLVSPADVEGPGFPTCTSGFDPMPLAPLPFPSLIVISTDDEYVSLERAGHFANQWGGKLVNVGARGHINSASGLGDWPEGYALLKTFF